MSHRVPQPDSPPCGQLVLASASPARAALLTGQGLIFTTCPAAIDESAAKRAGRRLGHDAARIAARLAWLKARQVARNLPAIPSGTISVIGADQMLDCAGTWLDKPGTIEGVHTQLRTLRGRTHTLWSAVSLWRDGQSAGAWLARADLTMRPLSDAEIDAYVATEGASVTGCVGGYRIEAAGARLFTHIGGGQDVIMGLPLAGLLAALRD